MTPAGLCICGIAVTATGQEINSSQIKLQQVMSACYKKLQKTDTYGLSTDTWHLLAFDKVTKK